jgi:ribosome-binding protein aMBF1 (putative translation factor)
MNVITIESEAFKKLMEELRSIDERFAEIIKKAQQPLSERWLDNQEVCEILNISKRTLQTYRDEQIIPYSQIGNKLYYRAKDIERFLNKHYVSHKAKSFLK